MKTINSVDLERESVLTTPHAAPPAFASIVHHFVNRFRKGCLTFLQVFQIWKGSRKSAVCFVVLAAVLFGVLLFKQPDYAGDMWAQRASLTMKYVEAESKREAGPYLAALAAHRRLLSEALKNLELRRGKIPKKVLAHEAQFEASFAEAMKALETPVEDEQSASKSIKKSASALEVASKALKAANSSGPRFGIMLSTEDAKPLIQTFLTDAKSFEEKAAILLSAPQKTFQQAEDACMASRFAAMSALLGWPELGRDKVASAQLSSLVTKLELTQKATSQLSTALLDQDQSRLVKYASSEGRRLKLLRALRANDMQKAQDAVTLAALGTQLPVE